MMTDERVLSWIEDIDKLALELPKLHKNMFFSISEGEFYNSIKEFKDNIKSFDDYIAMTELAKIVASIGDTHTSAIMPITKVMPFEFYWFDEEIYIISVPSNYKDLLFSKIIEINNIPIEEVTRDLRTVISHENESCIMWQLPRYLISAEVLYGLEIIDEIKEIKLKALKYQGELKEITVETMKFSEVNEIIFENLILDDEDIPLYRSYRDKNYWGTFLRENKIVYIKYNKCKEMASQSVDEFSKNALNLIYNNDIRGIVVDLRNNSGGNSTLLDPFIDELSNYKKINNEVDIFVIVGRETFSSALLNAYALKNRVGAIIIGEPTAGKPNCYGEIQRFQLPNSKLTITYSTEFYKLIDSDKVLSLIPDVTKVVSFDEYARNIDPCMDYICFPRGPEKWELGKQASPEVQKNGNKQASPEVQENGN